MTARTLRKQFHIAEYAKVLHQAGEDGWLAVCVKAHITPCTQAEAHTLITYNAKAHTRVRWGCQRGWARYRNATGYSISLPSEPGTVQGRLRVGLVLHEIAHVRDHLKFGKFGHAPRFGRAFASLLTSWRPPLIPQNYSEIYERQPGPYTVLLIRSLKHSGKQISDSIPGPLTAEQAHTQARAAVSDPASDVIDAFVYSDHEGQFTGAMYDRKHTYDDLIVARGVAVAPQRSDPALLPSQPKPVRDVESRPAIVRATVEHAEPRPQAVRRVLTTRSPGVGLIVAENPPKPWPTSPAAQLIRTTLDTIGPASVSMILGECGAAVQALGVGFPKSLIARLKQSGHIQEIQ